MTLGLLLTVPLLNPLLGELLRLKLPELVPTDTDPVDRRYVLTLLLRFDSVRVPTDTRLEVVLVLFMFR